MKDCCHANDNVPPNTREIWSRRLGTSPSDEDLHRFSVSVPAFLRVLSDWARDLRLDAANDNRSGQARQADRAQSNPRAKRHHSVATGKRSKPPDTKAIPARPTPGPT